MQSSLDWIKYDTGSKDNLLDESGFYQMFQSELQTGMKCFFFFKTSFEAGLILKDGAAGLWIRRSNLRRSSIRLNRHQSSPASQEIWTSAEAVSSLLHLEKTKCQRSWVLPRLLIDGVFFLSSSSFSPAVNFHIIFFHSSAALRAHCPHLPSVFFFFLTAFGDFFFKG